jgi:hypothetical protein
VNAVDVDTWWRQLGSAALVGTARRRPPSPADLVVPRADALPEEIGLDAAALGGALRRAGRLHSTATVAPPAAPERLPEAPPRAAQLIELLLGQPPTDRFGTEALLVHWCTTCHETGHRVPHRLLPQLLDRARSTDLRRRVATVTGERGTWLAGQNPDWSWLERARQAGPVAGAEATDPARTIDVHEWALLDTDLRVSRLTTLRERDPAAGRGLLLTTWGSESARDRRALLEPLRVGLGPDDEDFLESALDDRAGSVRELAAQLLDGLPASRRALRMAERLRPLLGEAGLLRRHLEVRLPEVPDAAGRRDGLGKPPPGRSARGWWLEQITAGAPFDVWEGPAEKVVPRIKDADVLAGLRRAAAARRDTEWARALLDRGTEPSLLAVLPTAEREARVLDALGSTPAVRVPALLTDLPRPWSTQASAAVVQRIDRFKPEEIGQVLDALIPTLAHGLHPDAVPALQRWRERHQLPRRYDAQIGSLIQTRTLRHTISEAFQT